MEMGLRIKALERAAKVHEGQPYGDLPYIVHVSEVAMVVAAIGGTDEEVAAAFLHDSVEDTDLTIEEIAAEFGAGVAHMVDGLTHPTGYTYERYMTEMPPVSQPIKFADSLRNLIRTMALSEDHPKREKWLFKYARNVVALIDVLAEESRWAHGIAMIYAFDPEVHAAIDYATQATRS